MLPTKQIEFEISNLPENNNENILIYHNKFTDLLSYYNKEYLDYVFYNKKKYIHNLDRLQLKQTRNLQQEFREELIKRYETCIITDRADILCEAAHIVPFAESNDDIKYDINNGLLLSKELHALFDMKYLKINPYTKIPIIELNDIVLNNQKCVDYHKYHGSNIRVKLNDETIQNLKKIY